MRNRIFSILFASLLALHSLFAAPACGAQTAIRPVSIADSINPDDHGGRVLVVHYFRPDDDYAGWNLWTWGQEQDGRAINFSGRTDFGRYAIVPIDRNTSRQGFIIRQGNWQAKDVDRDRWANLQRRNVTEVWLVSGDPRVFTDPQSVDFTMRITNAFLDAGNKIHLISTGSLDQDQRSRITISSTRDESTEYTVRRVERSRARAIGRLVYEVHFDPPVSFEDVASLNIHVPGFDTQTVYAREVLTEDRFTALDAQLGAFCTPESTIFRVWSPVSESVQVMLYESVNIARPVNMLSLTHIGRGVWETEVEGDLHGYAYVYNYRSYGVDRFAPDIHAFAANVDSTRSVVVDLSRTHIPGWGEIDPPKLAQPTDEVIYEIHVRDFTVADTSLDPALRGTYLGLLHEGTVGGVRTGLAHLKELGVTAVHLLPIQDFTAPLDQYNWGYWTTLFNVPESNYSTNPRDPLQAIRDVRQMVHTLHENGIRVILDVVYNHTSSSFEWSPIDQSVPWYYFRTSIDGQLLNDAGVGNSIADERPMVRKYIVDSTVFWLEEYRIDGYRFDLIGTHHPATVRAVCDALLPIRPDITLYGEPWTGGGHTHFPKGAQRGMRMAVFNDHLRNAIRGDLDGTSTGFATGPGGDRAAIRRGVAGAIDDFADQPIETVNYVSAHDNLTLWDKLLHARPDASEREKRAMQKLSLGIVLTSQGIAFLHGGSDFARTKGGNHNSYNAGDEVNKFDWPRKARYREVFDYTRGLIQLRRECPLLRFSDTDTIRQRLRFLNADPLIAFTIDGSGIDEAWPEILVAYNGEPRRQRLALPPGDWELIVDHQRAGTEAIRRIRANHTLPEYSMIVLRRAAAVDPR